MEHRHIRPTDDEDGGPVIVVVGLAALVFFAGVIVGGLLW
jgi:hypothetical protein